MTGMAELVHVETDEAVATIRLDRPPMNPLNGQVQDEIAAAAARLTADESVRAVVVYGGEKVFAAGADISEMAEASYARRTPGIGRLQPAYTAVAKIVKPVLPRSPATRSAAASSSRCARTSGWRARARGS